MQFLYAVEEKSTVSSFHVVFLAVIALYLLQAGIQLARGYFIIAVARSIDLGLSLSYYNHLTDLPVSSIAVRQTGEYLSRFSDAGEIRTAISSATLTLVLDALMVIACGVILYSENRLLFFVALLMVLFYAAIVLLYRKPLERSNRQMMEQNAVMQFYFKESIDGLETVKAACAGTQSSICCKSIRLANGSPPVNTKSQRGVMASTKRMLSQILSRLNPLVSAYSTLLMQKGQLLLQL